MLNVSIRHLNRVYHPGQERKCFDERLHGRLRQRRRAASRRLYDDSLDDRLLLHQAVRQRERRVGSGGRHRHRIHLHRHGVTPIKIHF